MDDLKANYEHCNGTGQSFKCDCKFPKSNQGSQISGGMLDFPTALRIWTLTVEERLIGGAKLKNVLINGKMKTVITTDDLLNNLNLIAESDKKMHKKFLKNNPEL